MNNRGIAIVSIILAIVVLSVVVIGVIATIKNMNGLADKVLESAGVMDEAKPDLSKGKVEASADDVSIKKEKNLGWWFLQGDELNDLELYNQVIATPEQIGKARNKNYRERNLVGFGQSIYRVLPKIETKKRKDAAFEMMINEYSNEADGWEMLQRFNKHDISFLFICSNKFIICHYEGFSSSKQDLNLANCLIHYIKRTNPRIRNIDIEEDLRSDLKTNNLPKGNAIESLQYQAKLTVLDDDQLKGFLSSEMNKVKTREDEIMFGLKFYPIPLPVLFKRIYD